MDRTGTAIDSRAYREH